VQWGEAIIDGINESLAMVLIFSRNANASQQLVREVDRAVNRGIPVLPLRIEDVPLSKALEYYISSSHWLDALTEPLEEHLDDLVEAIRQLVTDEPDSNQTANAARERAVEPIAATGSPPVRSPSPSSTTAASTRRRLTRIAFIAVGVASAGVLGMLALQGQSENDPTPPTPPQNVTLEIDTIGADLLVGDTVPLHARIDGKQAGDGERLVWRISDPTVATIVTGNAALIASGAGTAWLHAEVGEAHDSVSVTVRRPSIASLRIERPPRLRVGQSFTLSAVAADQRGRTMPEARATWTSSRVAVATVNPQRGVVRGLTAGRATLTARVATLSASVEVLVDPGPTGPDSAPKPNPGPTGPDTTTKPNPVPPPPSGPQPPGEDGMQKFAQECAAALERGDAIWFDKFYGRASPTDQDNLEKLLALMKRRNYKMGVLWTKAGETSADFQVMFQYQTAFGPTRETEAQFNVQAVLASGQWRLASCKVVGTPELR
jgi:hypothetical protein